jgi:hypothetical protein
MGAGISLSKKQIINIIKRELEKQYYDKQNSKDIYYNGYLIYYDFQDEVDYNNILKNIDKYINI